MIVASEARIMGNLSGPRSIADETGPILEHVAMTEGPTMYDIVDGNREYLAQTEQTLEHFTLDDAKRARALVAQLAQIGSMFDYWIMDNGVRVGDIELIVLPGDKKPELGYWLIEEAQGKGLATRAARALLEYSFTLPYVSEATMWIRPENTASQQVAKRIGAQISGQGQREWLGQLVGYDIWEVSRDAK
jgi:RimJ/RimL family protein N-acetyltransferase